MMLSFERDSSPWQVMSFIIELTLSVYITTTGGGHSHSYHKEPQVLTRIPSGNTSKLLRLDVGVTTGLYEPPKRILVVCSSHARGLYLSEFAEPYNLWRKKFGGREGLEFVLASPKGGSVSSFDTLFNPFQPIFDLGSSGSNVTSSNRQST